jgi:hypothetical protein
MNGTEQNRSINRLPTSCEYELVAARRHAPLIPRVVVLKAHSGQSKRGIPRLALDVLFGNIDEIFPSQLHPPRSKNGVIPRRDFGQQWSNLICCFLQFTNSEVNSTTKIKSSSSYFLFLYHRCMSTTHIPRVVVRSRIHGSFVHQHRSRFKRLWRCLLCSSIRGRYS